MIEVGDVVMLNANGRKIHKGEWWRFGVVTENETGITIHGRWVRGLKSKEAYQRHEYRGGILYYYPETSLKKMPQGLKKL